MQAPPALKNSTKPTQAPATVPSTTNSYTARFQKSRCLNDTTSTKTKRLTSDMFNSQCSELARSQSINKSIPKEPYSSQNSQQFYYQSDKASTTVSYKAPLAFNPSSVKLKSDEVSSPNNRLNEGQKLMKPSESVVKPTGIDSNSTSPLSELRSSSRSPLPHQEYKYKDSYTSRIQGVNSKPQTAIRNEERSTSLIIATSSPKETQKTIISGLLSNLNKEKAGVQKCGAYILYLEEECTEKSSKEDSSTIAGSPRISNHLKAPTKSILCKSPSTSDRSRSQGKRVTFSSNPDSLFIF